MLSALLLVGGLAPLAAMLGSLFAASWLRETAKSELRRND